MTEERDTLVEAAMRWQGLGASVIPVGADKRPTIPSWKKYQETAATSSQVKAWMSESTKGLGVVLGDVSGGLGAFDFDNRGFHDWLLGQLDASDPIAELVGRISEGYAESSPKGVHWLVYIEGGSEPSMKLANDVDKTGLVEWRGAQSQLIVAPSNFGEGRAYEQIQGGPESIVTITKDEWGKLCEWLRSYSRFVPASRMVAKTKWEDSRSSRRGNRPGDDFNVRGTWPEVFGAKPWTQVGHDGWLRYWRRPGKAFGHSATTGVRKEGGPDILYNFTTSTDLEGERGYSRFTAFAVLQHGGDFSAAAKDLMQRGYGTALSFQQNDLGNAEVMCDLHGENLWYTKMGDKSAWLHWNQEYWERFATEQMEGLARSVPEALMEDALLAGDKKMEAWANNSANMSRITPMLKALTSAERIRKEPIDAGPDEWLLNCRNGTLHLGNGVLYTFKRNDFMTHQLTTEFNPEARSERLEEFLWGLAGDCATCFELLQKAVGYCLTGDTAEQKFFVLTGPTGSGKSTLMTALSRLLGPDLSVSLNPRAISAKNEGAQTNDLATMKGKRLVAVNEVPAGFKPANELLKRLSGGDPVMARLLYNEFEPVSQYAKIWLIGNDVLRLDYDDEAIQRRIALLPGGSPVEDGDRDSDLGDFLNSEEGRSALLAWAVKGAMAVYNREGLENCPQHGGLLEQARAGSNFACFLIDGAYFLPEERHPSAATYEAYTKWCEGMGIVPEGKQTFTWLMAIHGFIKPKSQGREYFVYREAA